MLRAEEMIGPIEPGCRVVGLTKGQFSLGDLIRVVLATTGPADVIVSTWACGALDAQNMKWLLDEQKVNSFTLFIDRSFPTRHPRYMMLLLDLFGEPAIRLTNTHAKFALIGNDRFHVVIRTSMNLNRNRRYESFDLDEDPEMYQFFLDLVEELLWLTPPGRATEKDVHRAYKRSMDKQAGHGEFLGELTDAQRRLVDDLCRPPASSDDEKTR